MRTRKLNNCTARLRFMIFLLSLFGLPTVSIAGRFQSDDSEDLSPSSIVSKDSARDSYWEYYAACDRWGIQFASGIAQDATIFQDSNKGPKKIKPVARLKSDHPSQSKFQQIKFVKPRPVKRSFWVGGLAAGKYRANLVWNTAKSFASSQFQTNLRPTLSWLEFSAVESAHYEEFFLEPKPGRIQCFVDLALTYLHQTWRSKIRHFEFGFSRIAGEVQFVGKQISRMKRFFTAVLQKYTDLDGSRFSTSDY